jgi:hypothetical protein
VFFRRIEINKAQKYLKFDSLDTPFATNAQGYSTIEVFIKSKGRPFAGRP